jgi:hypothetical protein
MNQNTIVTIVHCIKMNISAVYTFTSTKLPKTLLAYKIQAPFFYFSS